MSFLDRLFGSKAKSTETPPTPRVEPTPIFPHELIRVPGTDAVFQALAWREVWRGSFTPVVLGPKNDFDMIADVWDEVKESPQDFIQRAQAVNLPAWLEKRLGESSPLEDLTDESAWNMVTAASGDFATVTNSSSGKPYPWVWVAKVPTTQPCEVPAWLKLGGWNACPNTEEHVALWRQWQEKYGAEILCVTGDVIEATVARPPEDKEACYVLAREQFAYCDDIVTQGVGTIDALAASLRGSKSWFFWWD